MYDYQMQYPNMNVPKYTPRSVRKGMLTKAVEIFVDLSPLARGEEICVPSGRPQVAAAVWLSARINSASLSYGPKPSLGNFLQPELDFVENCRFRGHDCLYGVNTYLNTLAQPHGWTFHLNRVAEWQDLQLALMEGLTVMSGGSVYSSFDKALHTGIVPMPKPGEDLLGGQIVNIVGFNRDTELALAMGNMGTEVGKKGMFTYRGSHLRNWHIFRDYFVLIPRYTNGS